MQRLRTVQAERTRLQQQQQQQQRQDTKTMSAYDLNQGLKQLQRHRQQLETKLASAEQQVKHLTQTISTLEKSRRDLQVSGTVPARFGSGETLQWLASG